jgi:hypothetical protein
VSTRPGLGASVIRRATVARKPGHRGEREVSRKPSCGESRSDPVEPVVHSCVFCAHDRGCNRRPAFPAPSVLKEGEFVASLGRIAPRECGRISCRCLKFESRRGSDLAYPPLEGEGRSRSAMRSIVRSERGGVTVSRLEQCRSWETVTPPRLAFRCAQCEPTLPLQGRVKMNHVAPKIEPRSRGVLNPRMRGDDGRKLRRPERRRSSHAKLPT